MDISEVRKKARIDLGLPKVGIVSKEHAPAFEKRVRELMQMQKAERKPKSAAKPELAVKGQISKQKAVCRPERLGKEATGSKRNAARNPVRTNQVMCRLQAVYLMECCICLFTCC